MSNAGYALEMTGIRKVYPMADQEVVALDGIDMNVAEDEIVALIGPSGSGKTTLCTIAGGILTATDGRVSVGGEDITDYSPKRLTEFRSTRVVLQRNRVTGVRPDLGCDDPRECRDHDRGTEQSPLAFWLRWTALRLTMSPDRHVLFWCWLSCQCEWSFGGL